MLKHNLTLIFRSLRRNAIYTIVILLSLTVGFVCFNFLISFLYFETDTDTFHTNQNRVYQVFSKDPFGDGKIAYVPDYMHDYLISNYPEVERVCQLANLNNATLETQHNKLSELNIVTTDSSFFSFFDFPFEGGSTKKSLQPHQIVLTKDKAMALFGSFDVAGKLLTLTLPDTARELQVSAVVDNPVKNTHLTFDALVSHTVLPKKFNGGASYIILTGDEKALEKKINTDTQRPGLIGPGKIDYFINPLTDSYFNINNKMRFMKTRNPIFITVGYIVCGLVLFIASFNFINLYLLSAQNRKKEVGIKKALGLSTPHMFGYSVTETSVYILFAYLASVILTMAMLPAFNYIFEANITASYLLDLKMVTSVCFVLIVCSTLMVFLSAKKQSGMKAINLITRTSSKVTFSKALFTVQFTIAIVLAICAVTIINQMDYLKNAPLGFNRNLIQINTPAKESTSILKQKFLQLPGVNHVTAGSGNPISGNMMMRLDLDEENFYSPFLFEGDDDFINTLGLELLEGEMPSEKNQGKLVNQKLVLQFKLDSPIGEYVPGTKDKITGVVKDFTCGSFKQEIPPVIIAFSTTRTSLLIDFSGNDLAQLLPALEATWNSAFPDHAFVYRVIQEELMKKYKEDTLYYKIIVTFSIICILLSSFGLFALSWAVVQNRAKEMGIRKVLGATVTDILNLLTITFTKRILLAFVIAAPVGYIAMTKWLDRFANKIELGLWIFITAGILVGLVAVFTLSLQTIKTALINPVDQIRTE